MNPEDQLNFLEKRVLDLEDKTKNLKENALLNQFSVDPQSVVFLKDFIGSSMPTGRSYKTSAQSIADVTTTKVQYDTNDFAYGIKWDSTNYRFYVPMMGRYLVNGSIYYSAPLKGQHCQMLIYKNGAEYVRATSSVGSVNVSAVPAITEIVSCAAGDYIEIYTRQDSGISQSTNDLSPSASRFSICLI